MKRGMQPAHAKKSRHTFRNDLRKNGIYLLLLLPAVVYVIIFFFFSMGGVIMAFKSYNYTKGLFASPWVGMKNFDFLMVSGKLWLYSGGSQPAKSGWNRIGAEDAGVCIFFGTPSLPG